MTSSTKSHCHQMPISLDFMKRSVFIDLSLQLSTLPVISVALVGCDVSESELFPLGAMALAEMTDLKEHSQACVERLRDVARTMGEVVGTTVKPGERQCDADDVTQTRCGTNNGKATRQKERIKWHIVVPPGLRQQSITV